MVVLVGLVVSGSVAWTASMLNTRTEHRLLEVQTRQASAVISSTILTLIEPLRSALRVAEATNGDPAQFRALMAPLAGPGRPFVTAWLWQVDGSALRVTASTGGPPALSADPRQAFAGQALRSETFVVTSIGRGPADRVGYAISSPSDRRFVVYAERAIPANRQVEVEAGSAFADLHFATYLGTTLSTATLATTDVPVSELPLTGDTVREQIPFGNTSIILVTVARGQLGGGLGGQLALIFLVGGALLTFLAAGLAHLLVRRRWDAVRDAQTIAGLYDRLDVSYGQERSIAQALQQALLPASNPAIKGLEIASRYVAGAQGVDIGGDWYSIIALDGDRFGFVIGDVSGRGVSAATIMARLRFTTRAYLIEGHPPDVVLEMCAHQIDIEQDGHFATVLIGVGDLATRTVNFANAGHFEPLILSSDRPEFAPTKVGVPLGVVPGSYELTTIEMTEGSALIAYTDGLVERRGESLDDGLIRLATAVSFPPPTLEGLLSRLVVDLTGDGAEDDIALLAFRWTGT